MTGFGVAEKARSAERFLLLSVNDGRSAHASCCYLAARGGQGMIMEGLHAIRVLFFHQEKSFQDLLLISGYVVPRGRRSCLCCWAGQISGRLWLMVLGDHGD
jgi:hypothetical protein